MLESKKKIKKHMGKFVLGIVVGSAVGSIVGLTMAPKSGRELRGDISRQSKKTWGRIEGVIEKRSDKNTVWHVLNKIFVRKKRGDK
ncbi:MAG: YtxH domain-containing protein [Candidatus Gracilibacteria bacterium]|jgi:gas vesicle protein|nr:YtxH domain-containing protein [Candidatus Gracilibacteria bacterium]